MLDRYTSLLRDWLEEKLEAGRAAQAANSQKAGLEAKRRGYADALADTLAAMDEMGDRVEYWGFAVDADALDATRGFEPQEYKTGCGILRTWQFDLTPCRAKECPGEWGYVEERLNSLVFIHINSYISVRLNEYSGDPENWGRAYLVTGGAMMPLEGIDSQDAAIAFAFASRAAVGDS